LWSSIRRVRDQLNALYIGIYQISAGRGHQQPAGDADTGHSTGYRSRIKGQGPRGGAKEKKKSKVATYLYRTYLPAFFFGDFLRVSGLVLETFLWCFWALHAEKRPKPRKKKPQKKTQKKERHLPTPFQ
jgi:hypothetical protein